MWGLQSHGTFTSDNDGQDSHREGYEEEEEEEPEYLQVCSMMLFYIHNFERNIHLKHSGNICHNLRFYKEDILFKYPLYCIAMVCHHF